MGKSSGVDELAFKLGKFADAIGKADVESVQRGALVMTTVTRTTIAAAAGGDNILSGVGKKGRAVGARFDVKPGAVPGAVVKATGPLQLIERSTVAHQIPRVSVETYSIKTRKRTGRTRQRGVLKLPQGAGGNRFGFIAKGAQVRHPGTTGKHPFELGVNASWPATLKAMQAPVTKSLAKVFR